MRYKMIFVMLNEQLNDLYRNNLDNLMEMYSVLDGQKIFNYVGPLCFAYLLLGRTLFKFKIQINDYWTRNKWMV